MFSRMPVFPYQEVDEIEPELDQHVQIRPGAYNISSPIKPILSSTPLYTGILQVLVGLITAGLGKCDMCFYHMMLPLRV